MKKNLILIISVIALMISGIQAQKTFNPMGQAKHVIWGQGYNANSFSRFPADAQQTIPSDVWNQTLRSSGLHVRFVTNATSITVNYALSSQYSSNNWFSTVGANGLDLYAHKPDGKWYWCHPNSRTIGSVFTYSNINPDDAVYNNDGYEFYLYFPTFAITSSISITVNSDAKFEFIPVNKDIKPIVVYGTSVVHGAVCSRPGNTWTNIVGRNFPDRPIVNLGFSGVGRVEPEVVEVINRIDAEIYVIDCLPNFSNTTMPPLIDARYKSAIDTLTKYHPNAAILLTEHFGYSDMEMWKARKDLVLADNIELKKVYDYFIGKGYKNLYYLSREDLNIDLSSDIGDYVHPNDKGMYRFAEVYTAKITEILNRNASKVSQTKDESFNIYPNPNKGTFELNLPEDFQQNIQMEIIDMSGRLIHKQTLNPQSDRYLVPQLSLKTGHYIMSVSNENRKISENLVIE